MGWETDFDSILPTEHRFDTVQTWGHFKKIYAQHCGRAPED